MRWETFLGAPAPPHPRVVCYTLGFLGPRAWRIGCWQEKLMGRFNFKINNCTAAGDDSGLKGSHSRKWNFLESSPVDSAARWRCTERGPTQRGPRIALPCGVGLSASAGGGGGAI